MTTPIHSAKGSGEASAKPLPGAARFYARNGDVFTAEGRPLHRDEEHNCLAFWRDHPADREPWVQAICDELADELDAAIAHAEAQLQERKAA